MIWEAFLPGTEPTGEASTIVDGGVTGVGGGFGFGSVDNGGAPLPGGAAAVSAVPTSRAASIEPPVAPR